MTTDNVSQLKRIDVDRSDKDPFLEANANSELEHLEEAYQEVKVGADLPEDVAVAESSEIPEQIQSVKAKHKKAGTGRGVTFTAMGLSLVAIASSSYSVWSQESIRGAISEQITSVETYATDLRILTEAMTLQVSANTGAIAENSTQAKSLTDLRGDMMIYNSVLDQMKSDVLSMRGSVVQGQELIGSQRSALDALTGRVSSLESKPIPKTAKVYRTTTPVQKAKVDTTTIGGASLASIDAWGSQTNVMLRDENGGWVSLLEGDFYKGWQLISARGNKAEFKNGKQNRSIRLEG